MAAILRRTGINCPPDLAYPVLFHFRVSQPPRQTGDESPSRRAGHVGFDVARELPIRLAKFNGARVRLVRGCDE